MFNKERLTELACDALLPAYRREVERSGVSSELELQFKNSLKEFLSKMIWFSDLDSAFTKYSRSKKPRTTFQESYAKSFAFNKCCLEANWPLFSIEEHAKDKIFEIHKTAVSKKDLTDELQTFALGYYSDTELLQMQDRWLVSSLTGDDVKRLLLESISRHIKKDYLASTSVLACLLDRLLGGLLYDLKESSGIEKAATKRQLKNYLSENDEVPTEMSLFLYLLNCTLLSGSIEYGITDANPLRNKICHGDQTNYDTVIHSLKSILLVDSILSVRKRIRSSDF